MLLQEIYNAPNVRNQHRSCGNEVALELVVLGGTMRYGQRHGDVPAQGLQDDRIDVDERILIVEVREARRPNDSIQLGVDSRKCTRVASQSEHDGLEGDERLKMYQRLAPI